MAGCIAHARNGYISTLFLTYDVTVVFLEPDFVFNAKNSAIQPIMRVILHILLRMRYTVFMGGGKTGEGVMRYDPRRIRFFYGFLRV